MDHKMGRTVAVVRGGVAGTMATGAMSLVMEAGRRVTPFRRQPPKLIVRKLLTGHPARAASGEGETAREQRQTHGYHHVQQAEVDRRCRQGKVGCPGLR